MKVKTLLKYFEDCATKESFQFEDKQLIRALIRNVEKQSLDIIKSKPVATRGYSPTYKKWPKMFRRK